MAKLPVQVTGDGTLDFSRVTKAYTTMANASRHGCRETKQRASDIADQWDERATRCEEVGTQTEQIRGTTVVMDLQACETNAALWRLLTEHKLNMYPNIRDMRTLQRSLTPIKMKGQGKIGDFSNLEKLNGNDDMLVNYDGQLSVKSKAYSEYNIIDINDEGTYGAFLMARCIGINEDYHLVDFECECGTPDVRVDSYRSEVYCDCCGLVNDLRLSPTKQSEYDLEGWEFKEYLGNHDESWRDDTGTLHWSKSSNPWENWTGKELPEPPVVTSEPYIELHVEPSGIITFTCPLTAEVVTKETQRRVAEQPWTEAITIARNPIHKLEIAKRNATVELQKHEQVCKEFCRECERLDKRVTGIGRKLSKMRMPLPDHRALGLKLSQ